MNYNREYKKLMMYAYNNIKYYKQMITFSSDLCQRIFYIELLNREINWFNQLYLNMNNIADQENEVKQSNQKEFSLEELSQYDGSSGRPAYVAVNGIVYDVSIESAWGGGTHFGLYAGKDLTSQFACHGGSTEVLKKLPQVGVLKEE